MTKDTQIKVIDHLSDEQLEKIGFTRETFKGSKTELFLQCLLELTEQTINEDTQLLMKEYNLSFGEAIQEFERRLINLTNIIKETSDENRELKKEIKELKDLIKLIADADSIAYDESVKEVLRHYIKGVDSVAGESAGAWHEYCILSNFFKEHYKEQWDNE